MPRHLTIAKVRLNNISKCMAITANTLDDLVNTLNITGLEAISNTTQSLLKLMQTIKQDKDDCAELMEHTHQFLSAIIGVYIKSDTGAGLPPSTLNQIAKFTETLQKVHTFIEAQQSGSKIKRFFQHGELSALLNRCRAELQNGLDFFQFKTTADVMVDVTKLQDQAQLRHQEVLDIIEAVSSSDPVSSISKMYSASYTSSKSLSMLPAEPKIFHGRDSEVAEILKLFHQGIPRITILGAGGMGKTSLARTVMHHQEVTTKYQGNRFFIVCDTVSNKAELAGLIGAHLGMKPAKDLTQAILWHFSNALPSLLILDNLETPWEPLESRKEIEELLSLLADIASLALLVTMRGAERPSKVQWTRPFLLPLGPLPQKAAQRMFIDIADDRHSMEEVDQVLRLADNMPLSISLLAHLVDMEDCSTILSRWETEKTSLISEGYDKRSSLESSISLSLSSPRITTMPHSQDLLSLLSILPDGLSDVELKQSKFPIKDVLGCKSTLLRTALAYTDDRKHLKVLVPIREYMTKLFPPTDQMIRPLFKHFHELLKFYMADGGKASGTFLTDRITSNYTNIQTVLRHNMHWDHLDVKNSIYCAIDFNRFSRQIGHGVTILLDNISHLLLSLDDHRLKVYFIVELLNSEGYYNSTFPPEAMIAEALDHLKHFDDPILESRFHRSAAVYYSQYKDNVPRAVDHCHIALHLARVSADYKGQCDTLEILAFNDWLSGNYTAGQAYAQQGQRLAKISANLEKEARALNVECLCWKAMGNYRHCITLSSRTRALLSLCGMSHGDISHSLINGEAEVHKCKSEYVEAHNIHNQTVQNTMTQNPYRLGFTLVNIAEIEVFLGVLKNDIQEKIDSARFIAKERENITLGIVCDCVQADLNLREGDTTTSLFSRCLHSALGNLSEAVSYCLERLGDHSRWEGSHHPSSWTTVFLVHSLKAKERLESHKALQFLGDLFLKEGDEFTAISLFTLALEGFTQMDVHHSRAECMIRLGDISSKSRESLKALEFWETARPLFERSSQAKRVQDIDERLAKIGVDVKEQYRIKLAQLIELDAPVETMEENDMSDSELEKQVEAHA